MIRRETGLENQGTLKNLQSLFIALQLIECLAREIERVEIANIQIKGTVVKLKCRRVTLQVKIRVPFGTE